MSKYEDQTDPNNSICPYCGGKYQVESEDYSEYEQEIICEECGKKYFLVQDISVFHDSRPDCSLNGDSHEYEPGHNKHVKICKICGHVALI